MIPQQSTAVFPIEDFSGGQRSTGTFFSRVPSSPFCQNAYSKIDKLLRKRPGYASDGVPAGSTAVTGLYEFVKSNILTFQMKQENDTISYMSNKDNTWVTLKTGIAPAIAEFETFTGAAGNTLLHTTHDNARISSWDGVAATMTVDTSAGAPSPKYLKVWNNHVFAAGMVANPSRIQFTNLATYNSWQTNSIDNYDDNCMTSDGDFITGFGELRGNLYVFKRFSIFRMTYLGSTPLFQVLKVVSGVGCIANKTIIPTKLTSTNLDGTTSKYEVLIFLTADKKIVAFDGQYITYLSDANYEDNFLTPFYMKNMNSGVLSLAHAIFIESENLYILFYANAQSSYNNCAFALNIVTRSIMPWTNMNFCSSASWTSSTNNRLPYVGDYSGNVYRFFWGSSDAGSAITFIYETDLIDSKKPETLKKGRYLSIYTKPRSNTTITVSRTTGWDSEFREPRNYVYTGGDALGTETTLGTWELGSDYGATIFYDVPETVNQFRFRIYETSTLESFVIHRLDLSEQGLGFGTNQYSTVTVSQS